MDSPVTVNLMNMVWITRVREVRKSNKWRPSEMLSPVGEPRWVVRSVRLARLSAKTKMCA